MSASLERLIQKVDGLAAERLAEQDGNGWTDPSPLPTLPAVPAFPLEILPDALQGWAADLSDRTRYPLDFISVSAMVALGSILGRKIGIRLKAKDTWTEHANVWGAIIGPPSALKSPALRDGLAPLRRLQALADELHAKEVAEYEGKTLAAEAKNDAEKANFKKAAAKGHAGDTLEQVEVPRAPPPRCLYTSDSTYEKLTVLAAENPTGLLIERDELAGFLTALEAEDQAAGRAFYLSGWSGRESYRTDRIGRGTVRIGGYALSILGGIQPGPLDRYVRSAFSGEKADGLLQRFQLAVWPDPAEYQYVDRWPDQDARSAAWAVFEQINNLDPKGFTRDQFSYEPFVRLDPEAQATFEGWIVEHMAERREAERQGEVSAVSAHFGKYPGLLAKLTLLIHFCDNPDSGYVTEVTLLKALSWLDYLAPHAQRIYHAASAPATDTARLLLARLRKHSLPNAFKARDIYRKCWHGMGDPAKVQAALRLLVDFGHLREIPTEKAQYGRPPDPEYLAHPTYTEVAQ
jgi:putative DNA primase/helicase